MPLKRFDLRRHSRATSFILAAGLMITNSPAFAASDPPLDPSGLWTTKDDESVVKFAPCSKPPALCGTVVWLKDPLENGAPKKDVNNPDKTKRSRPLLGIEILTELVADDDHWKGKAYNADDGKTYDITFKVIPDKDKSKPDTGEITGCILRFLCKSETFTKVQTVPAGGGALPGLEPAAAPTAHGAKPAAPHTH